MIPINKINRLSTERPQPLFGDTAISQADPSGWVRGIRTPTKYEEIETRFDKGFFQELKDSAKSAWHGTIAGYHSGSAIIKHITGKEPERVIQSLDKAAERMEMMQQHQPRIQRWEEIGGVRDAVSFAQNAVIQSLPVQAQIIGGAVTGAKLGSIAGPKGTIGGSLVGSFSVGYALYSGSIMETAYSQGADVDTAAKAGLAWGAPAAGVSIIVPAGITNYAMGIFGRGAIRSKLQNVMRTMAISIPSEGLAEAIAENFVMEGELMAIPGHTISREERKSRTINAGIAGGISIGITSGVMAGTMPSGTTMQQFQGKLATEADVVAEIARQAEMYEDSLRYRRNQPLETELIKKYETIQSPTQEQAQFLNYLKELQKQPISTENVSDVMADYDTIAVDVYYRTDAENAKRASELLIKPKKTYAENLELSAISIHKPKLYTDIVDKTDPTLMFPETQKKAETAVERTPVEVRPDEPLKRLEPHRARPDVVGEQFVAEEARGVQPTMATRKVEHLDAIRTQTKDVDYSTQLLNRILGELNSRRARAYTRTEIADVQKRVSQAIDQANISKDSKDTLRKQVRQFQTREDLIRKMPEFIQKVERAETRQALAGLKENIKKVINKTKVKERVAKMTPEIQEVFNVLREDIKLTQEKAQEKLNNNLVKYQDDIPPFGIALENKILALMSDSTLLSQSDATELLNALTELIEEGKNLRDIEIFEEWQKIENDIEQVMDSQRIVEGTEAFGIPKKTFIKRIQARLKTMGISWMADWETVMKTWFWNTPVDQTESAIDNWRVTENNSKYAEQQGSYQRSLMDSVRNAYSDRINEKLRRFPERTRKFLSETEMVSNLVIQDIVTEDVNLGSYTNIDGVTQNLQMKRGELIKRYIELQDPTLLESFTHGNRWSQSMVDAVITTIESSPSDMAMAQEAMRIWQEHYGLVNEAYKKIYGVNLHKNPFYSNIKRQGFEIDADKAFGEFIAEQNYRTSVTATALKDRLKTTLPIAKQDVFQALDKHMGETNYFIAWGEQVRRLHKVFNDRRVQDGTRSTLGENAGNSLIKVTREKIQEFANRGHKNSSIAEGAVGKLRKGFVFGRLMAKPAITLKQTVSRVNYLEVLSPQELFMGELEFWRNPRENMRILEQESPFLKERGKFQERDVNALLSSNEFARFTKMKSAMNVLMLNVRLGDRDATLMPASWAYRKKMLKDAGITDTKQRATNEVIKRYENFGEQTQQSSHISTMSQLQTGGEYAKLMTAFMTQQAQNYRKVFNATQSLFQEGGFSQQNLKKVAKTIFIYHVLQNALFQAVSTGIIQLMGDEDQEFWKDIARASILGSFNGVFIVGDLLDATVRSVLGMQVWEPTTPIAQIERDITKFIKGIDFDDISDTDLMGAIDNLARIGSDFGLPTEQVLNATKGTADLLEGNYDRGILGILQWSQWALQPLEKDERDRGIRTPSMQVPNIQIPSTQIPRIRM